MDEFFVFRNFQQFDHSRTDVRIPIELLSDKRFRQLADAQKAHLICLLLLAARNRNRLPNRPLRLQYLIGATEPLRLGALSEFIEVTPSCALTPADRLERRRIPDDLRATVLLRDGGRCRKCGSARNLEIDHIVPLSRGGTSDELDLETLCRRCNRRKWRKLVPRL